MPKYDVQITKIIEIATTVTVSAKDESIAEEKALKQAESAMVSWQVSGSLEWEEQDVTTQVDDIDEA